MIVRHQQSMNGGHVLKGTEERLVLYDGISRNPNNKVSYRVYGRHIVFSGIFNGTQGARGSTFNYAEDIVEAIAKQEGIDPRGYTFYDLQTQRGYASHEYKPGHYCFNKLRPTWGYDPHRPDGMQWREGHPALQVLEDFREYLWWHSAGPGVHVNVAVRHGAIKDVPLPTNTIAVFQ